MDNREIGQPGYINKDIIAEIESAYKRLNTPITSEYTRKIQYFLLSSITITFMASINLIVIDDQKATVEFFWLKIHLNHWILLLLVISFSSYYALYASIDLFRQKNSDTLDGIFFAYVVNLIEKSEEEYKKTCQTLHNEIGDIFREFARSNQHLQSKHHVIMYSLYEFKDSKFPELKDLKFLSQFISNEITADENLQKPHSEIPYTTRAHQFLMEMNDKSEVYYDISKSYLATLENNRAVVTDIIGRSKKSDFTKRCIFWIEVIGLLVLALASLVTAIYLRGS